MYSGLFGVRKIARKKKNDKQPFEFALVNDIEVLAARHIFSIGIGWLFFSEIAERIWHFTIGRFTTLFTLLAHSIRSVDRLIRRGVIWYLFFYWLLNSFQTHHSIKSVTGIMMIVQWICSNVYILIRNRARQIIPHKKNKNASTDWLIVSGVCDYRQFNFVHYLLFSSLFLLLKMDFYDFLIGFFSSL